MAVAADECPCPKNKIRVEAYLPKLQPDTLADKQVKIYHTSQKKQMDTHISHWQQKTLE